MKVCMQSQHKVASQMDSKLRFVRCPVCRQVLPESPGVPVYECGGCGTILQAKNQKGDTKDTGSVVHEADPTQEHLMSPSTEESDLEKILQRSGNGIGCRDEGNGDLNQSHECHSSDVISCHENTESSPETIGQAEAEEEKFPFVQYGTMYHNELGGDDIELPGDISVTNNILSSPKINSHKGKSLVNGPGDLSPRKEDESRSLSENISYRSQNYSQNCQKELPTRTGFSGDLSSCYESCEDGDLSSVSGTVREVDDESLKNHSISRSLAAVSFPLANPEDQIRKAQTLSFASESLDNQLFLLSEQTKPPQEKKVFQRVSSVDTLENIPQVYGRTDLGVTLRSSTAKHYYDYGVNTSCVETEDELPIQHLRPSRRTFKNADSRSTNGMPKRDELLVNYGMSGENKLPPRPINSSTTLLAKKHYSTKGSKWSQGEFQESSRPVGSKMTTETGEYWSRPPIYSKGSQVVKNGNCTSYEPKSLPAKTIDPESETQLLRMVYELQDQLKRINHIRKEMPHSRFSSRVAKKEQLPAYSNHFALNGERYPDLRYAFNPGRLDQLKTSFQQGKAPRMAFSGDASHYRHEVDCSCLRCYRQKWHYSAQLPRHANYDEGNTVLFSRGPRHSSRSPYQYKSSEFPWSHDTMLDGIHQKNDEVKKKQHPAKQHFRPIAGGAPIIACYCCNTILQLPADFLLFKRKFHRLRCSACNVVLNFSLVNRIHIVEYNPEPRTAPPGEVSGYTDTTNFAPASCAIDRQHGEPLSSIDGYGQSSHKSFTEMERSSLAPPSETLNGIYIRQKMLADDPFETKKDGKRPIMQDPRISYSSRETFEFGGPSSKVNKPENVFSEIEEVPPEDGSPLHQLMGYSSPSCII